jgi:hypothetical protein
VPDAPAWLREAFKDGVDDREMVYRDGVERFRKKQRPYAGANPWCWLAQFDAKRVPCGGQPGKVIERFHFINRQRVGNVLWAARPLDGPLYVVELEGPGPTFIQLAEWDARNGGLACEHHHRRFDSHADSPSAPAIRVNYAHVPDHVIEFALDWGLEAPFEERFGQRLIGLDEPQPSPPRR